MRSAAASLAEILGPPDEGCRLMDFETFGGDGIVSRSDDPVQAWCDDDL